MPRASVPRLPGKPYPGSGTRVAQNRTRKWHTRQRLSSSSSRSPTSYHLHRYELTDKLLKELDPLFPAAFPFWHLGKPSHSRLPTTHVHYTHTPVYYASDGSGRWRLPDSFGRADSRAYVYFMHTAGGDEVPYSCWNVRNEAIIEHDTAFAPHTRLPPLTVSLCLSVRDGCSLRRRTRMAATSPPSWKNRVSC